jgi:hypothetical protein
MVMTADLHDFMMIFPENTFYHANHAYHALFLKSVNKGLWIMKQNLPKPPPPPGSPEARQPQAPKHKLPKTILWPADSIIAVGEQWQRLEDGRIEAIYQTEEELEWALRLTQWAREAEAERGTVPTQLTIFQTEQPNNYSE